jgi:DsbC/DsbD-like thiol-disulfide interchange protein
MIAAATIIQALHQEIIAIQYEENLKGDGCWFNEEISCQHSRQLVASGEDTTAFLGCDSGTLYPASNQTRGSWVVMRDPRVVLAALATTLFVSLLPAAENPADQHVKVQLISEHDAIAADQEFQVGIRFDLQDGWHTYWINPGDSGEAPRIDWELPAGFQPGAIRWPYPVRLSNPPFADYGYEHQVLLVVAVRPPPGMKEGVSERIAARVHYLVCRDICIPGQKQLVLTLPVKNRTENSSDLPLFEATRERLPRLAPTSWKISATSLGDEFMLNLKGGKLTGSPEFFPLEVDQIENAAPQKATTIPGGFRLHLKKSNQLLKPIPRLRGVMVLGDGMAYQLDVPVSRSSSHAQSIKN